MRRWLVLATLVVCLGSVDALAAGNSGDLDRKKGWRELEWGSAPPTEMVRVGGLGGMKVYRRGNDTMAVGDYEIDDLLYVYAKDQLYSVMIRTTSADAAAGLLEALGEAYGKPTQAAADTWTWDTRRVALTYARAPDGSARIVYTYMPLDEVRKQAERESVMKAAEELK